MVLFVCNVVFFSWLLYDPAASAKVSAYELFYSYEWDRLRAEATYTGKVLEVSGLSPVLVRYHGDECLVWLGRFKQRPSYGPMSAEEYGDRLQAAALNSDPLPAVVVRLRWFQQGKLKSRSLSGTVTVRGTCAGLQEDGTVRLTGCRVVE